MDGLLSIAASARRPDAKAAGGGAAAAGAAGPAAAGAAAAAAAAAPRCKDQPQVSAAQVAAAAGGAASDGIEQRPPPPAPLLSAAFEPFAGLLLELLAAATEVPAPHESSSSAGEAASSSTVVAAAARSGDAAATLQLCVRGLTLAGWQGDHALPDAAAAALLAPQSAFSQARCWTSVRGICSISMVDVGLLNGRRLRDCLKRRWHCGAAQQKQQGRGACYQLHQQRRAVLCYADMCTKTLESQCALVLLLTASVAGATGALSVAQGQAACNTLVAQNAALLERHDKGQTSLQT